MEKGVWHVRTPLEPGREQTTNPGLALGRKEYMNMADRAQGLHGEAQVDADAATPLFSIEAMVGSTFTKGVITDIERSALVPSST